MRNPGPGIAGLCFTAALVAPLAPASPALQVFVSIPPQKFFVERIGGDRVEVSVMLEPGHVPETYEPPPRKIAALQSARLCLLMNVPFEKVWTGALPEQGAAFSVVDTGPPGGESAEHFDPHAWVAPEDAKRIARIVHEALRDADPVGAAAYSTAHDRLLGELNALEEDIRAMLDRPRTPYFIISHASLGRFAEAYGLEQIALEEGGKEAGPRRLAEIIRIARRENIGTVFVQRQYHSGAARTLARELSAEIVEIDPLAEDYLAGMRAIARAISDATR
jgi:zinc transport system substrate-binding protein